jgi:hypothetical protein
MRQLLLVVISGLVLPISLRAGAAEPRQIIEKAIAAVGGIEKVRQVRAIHVKLKGTYVLNGDRYPLTVESMAQFPDRYRQKVEIDGGANNEGIKTIIQAMDRDRAWGFEDGSLSPLDVGSSTEMRDSLYSDYVALLWPLLQDPGFRLTVGPSDKVDGRSIHAVRVSKAGKPDVTLFFDDVNGFLVRKQMRMRDLGQRREVLREEIFSDYRDTDTTGRDQKLLREANIASDDAGLLDYLRHHRMSDAERSKIQTLITKLGASSFEERVGAQQELSKQGQSAVPLIARAAESRDPEVASAAKECLQKIGKPTSTEIPAAIARLLVVRRPAGAVSALLEYLPNAPSEAVAREVRSALLAIGFQNGKPDPLIAKAALDKDPDRHSAASQLIEAVKKGTLAGNRIFIPGLKYAFQGEQLQDGKKIAEWRVIEVNFFSGFDDKIFSQP